MTPWRVDLTWAEVLQAAFVGVLRHGDSVRDRRRNRYGFTDDAAAWEIDINGCIGELATAKRLRRNWSGAQNVPKVADVDGYDVRTVTRRDDRLILHPGDPDDAIVILAVAQPPTVDLVGWLFAGEGKQQRFWKDPTGRGRWAFFVDRDALHPMTTLPRCEGGETC